MLVGVVRTLKSLLSSKLGKYLLMATLAAVGAAIVIPSTALGDLLGFQPLPLSFMLALGAIVLLYVTAAENVKRVFDQRVKF